MCVFKWKNQQNYAFFKLKKQHFLYKKWKFIMHFCNLCWMKNTFFIKKKCEKIALFLCVSCVFSEFLENRKFLQVQLFFRIFTVAACKYTGDHRQIMGRSWATRSPHRNQVSKKNSRKLFHEKQFRVQISLLYSHCM